MARSREIVMNMDNFVCPICLELYRRPRTLPCLHSFCNDCLVKYMSDFVDATKYKCPVCQHQYDNGSAIEKDSAKFVETHFLVNFFLDSLSTSCREQCDSSEAGKRSCEPCLSEGISATAFCHCLECGESLCKLCRSCHKRSKATKHHTTVDLSDNDEIAERDLQFLQSLTECPVHGGQEVLYLCKSHDKLCCHMCAIPCHQQCSSLVHIADIVKANGKDIDESLDVLRTKAAILYKHATRLIVHAAEETDNLTKSQDDVNEALKSIKKMFDLSFDRAKKKVLNEFAYQKSELEKTIQERKNEVEKFRDRIKSSIDHLSVVVKYGTPVHRFLAERRLRESVMKEEVVVRENPTFTHASYKRLRLHENDLCADGCLLTSLEIVCTEVNDVSLGIPFEIRNTELQAKVQLHQDSYKGRIKARMCLWIDEYIVVAIEGPNILCCVDIQSEKILSTYQCPSVPTSVRRWGTNQVAVCLPDSGSLLLCGIQQGIIIKDSVCKISPCSNDLFQDANQKFIISHSVEQNLVMICDTAGNEICMVDLCKICCRNCMNSHYIDFDAKAKVIYISCFEKKKVLAVDMYGNVVYEYRHENLQYPCSLTVDAAGNIYVPSTKGSSHSIHQISSEGRHIREFLLGEVMLPWCIRFHPNMTKFAVTDNSPDAQLKIYSFK